MEVQALCYAELTGRQGEASSSIAARIRAARAAQLQRGACNRELRGEQLRAVATEDPGAARLLANAVDRLGLTARAHDRLLRVARTVADLEASEHVAARHIGEALQFRGATME